MGIVSTLEDTYQTGTRGIAKSPNPFYITFVPEETQMTDLRYSTGEELFEFLYEKCKEDPDLLATIINEYVCSLSDNKLIELEDFLTNNFGDD